MRKDSDRLKALAFISQVMGGGLLWRKARAGLEAGRPVERMWL